MGKAFVVDSLISIHDEPSEFLEEDELSGHSLFHEELSEFQEEIFVILALGRHKARLPERLRYFLPSCNLKMISSKILQ